MNAPAAPAASTKPVHRVWVLGCPPQMPPAPPGGVPAGVEVSGVQVALGWAAALGRDAPVLVVFQLHAGAPLEALHQLRATAAGAHAPVVAVMAQVDAAAVAQLRKAGVARVLMQDEFAMQWPALLRAVT